MLYFWMHKLYCRAESLLRDRIRHYGTVHEFCVTIKEHRDPDCVIMKTLCPYILLYALD